MVSSFEAGKREPGITGVPAGDSAAHETVREILITLLSIYIVPDIFKALGKHHRSHQSTSREHFSIITPYPSGLSLLEKLMPRRGYVIMYPRSCHEAQQSQEDDTGILVPSHVL